MKKNISLILIILFLMPLLTFSQEVESSVNPTENLIQSSEETSDMFSVIQKTIEVGGELFKVLKRIISTIDNWLQNTIGISFSNLISSILKAIIGILEIILDLIRKILSN